MVVAEYKLVFSGAAAMIASMAIYLVLFALGLGAYFSRDQWIGKDGEDKLRAPNSFRNRSFGGKIGWVFLRFYTFLKASIFNRDHDDRTVSQADIEKANDYVFKLVENIKLVVVFLMVLTPSLLMTYQCTLPAVWQSQVNLGSMPLSSMFPCKEASEYGPNFYTNFRAYILDTISNNLSMPSSPPPPPLGLTEETSLAYQYYDSLSEMACSKIMMIYFGVVLFFEALTLLVCFIIGHRLFEHVKLYMIMFTLTALLWGLWPLIQSFSYGVSVDAADNAGFPASEADKRFVCKVPNAALISAVVSVWHSIVTFLAFFGHIVEKRLAEGAEVISGNKAPEAHSAQGPATGTRTWAVDVKHTNMVNSFNSLSQGGQNF